jgi:hypothetical protein
MVRKLKKEVRELVEYVDAHGWTVEEPSGRGYLKARCPCGRHLERISFTPSGSRTLMNKRKKFERTDCWPKEGRG